jgi:hypothetical protein
MSAHDGTVATQCVAPVPAHALLGETYGFWCQTIVLLAAAIFAYIQIRSSRAIERREVAAEAIFAARMDKDLTEARRKITELHASDKNMAAYAKAEGSDEIRTLRYALNHYEHVAVAIRQGIYDETIFKNASYTTLTRLYDRTKPFIDAMRLIKSPTVWQEFEWLMLRWKADPLVVKKFKSVEDKNLWQRCFGD